MPTPSDSPVPMRALLGGVNMRESRFLSLIREFVACESPSDSNSAVDACIHLAAARARNLGARVKIHRQHRYSDILEARFGPKSKSADSRILLLGHLDTVWPLGTINSMPCRIADGRLWGPGTLDMKAGVAMAFTALDMLLDANLLEREVVLLLNGDEEIGSPASRPVTEHIAKTCAAVYVLEPAQGLAYKTARKGIGEWRVQVQGVGAHAGVDFEKGANAVRELARVVERVSQFTDLKRGLTVSAGVIHGGTKTNVVPSEAFAEFDVRIPTAADASKIARKFAALKPSKPSRPSAPRCTLTVEGGMNRPPMERSRGTVALFRKAQSLAGELGFHLDEAATGGGSDGNFTAALGIPTLDGMGAVGEGAHAAHESIFLEHLATRTALLAGMIIR